MKWRPGRPEFPAIGATATLVAALALLPLGFIVAVAVATGPRVAAELIVRSRVGELLVDTGLLVALAVPLATALALAQAWLVERTDIPGRRLWAWTAVAPLAVPAFVQSYAWVSLLPRLNGLGAAVLVSVLAYSPFVYLPVAAQLRRLDPAYENAGASLGLPPGAVFRRVVLPQLRVALAGGALLVGLHLLGEYGLFAIVRFDTFTTAIVDQFQSTFNGPAANMLGGVLVVLCLLLLRLDRSLRGRERIARVGAGAAVVPTRQRLGRAAPLALAIPVAAALLALGVPAATLLRWLLAGGTSIWRTDVATALAETLALALAGGAVTTLLALPMAWILVRAPGRWQRVLEACHYYVGSLPGVVVALALVTITVRVALPLYQSVATLLLAYALLFLPRAVIGLRGSLAQVPPELERAALALGRPPARAIWDVTLRLASPGVAASVALAGLGVTNELVATLMLSPNGTRTLATEFWAYTAELDYAAAAPYALAMVILSAPLVQLLRSQSVRMAGR